MSLTTRTAICCHQCKSRRKASMIMVCTSGRLHPSKRVCRKKFCLMCLKRHNPLYISSMIPRVPLESDDTTGTSISTDVDREAYDRRTHTWTCPACNDECVCIGCSRRRHSDNTTLIQTKGDDDLGKFIARKSSEDLRSIPSEQLSNGEASSITALVQLVYPTTTNTAVMPLHITPLAPREDIIVGITPTKTTLKRPAHNDSTYAYQDTLVKRLKSIAASRTPIPFVEPFSPSSVLCLSPTNNNKNNNVQQQLYNNGNLTDINTSTSIFSPCVGTSSYFKGLQKRQSQYDQQQRMFHFLQLPPEPTATATDIHNTMSAMLPPFPFPTYSPTNNHHSHHLEISA